MKIKNLVLLVHLPFYLCSYDFICDFFAHKRVTLSLGTCERIGVVKQYLKKYMNRKHSLQAFAVQQDFNRYHSKFIKHISHNNWFILDFVSCQGSFDVLNYINDQGMFASPAKYLILVNRKTYNAFLEMMEWFEILPMSEIIVATFLDGSNNVTLYKPYKISKNTRLILETCGNWSKNDGMQNLCEELKIERRHNFEKYNIKISVVVKKNESINIENFDDLLEVTGDEPYFFNDFTNIYNLMQYINATFTLTPFQSYGYQDTNTGKFNGMIGDIVEGRSDITGSPFIPTDIRCQYLDLIKTFEQYGTKFILKRPSLSFVENIFLMTFTKKVWIATLLVLIVFGSVMYFLLNWEVKHKKFLRTRHNKYTLSDITLISLEAVCQQGTFTDSATHSGRIIILLFFTAFMFLYVAYSAYILVLLQSTTPITSIHELVNSRIECGGLNISFYEAYYKSTKDIDLRNLYQKKLSGRYFSMEKGLDAVRQGNFAFHVGLGAAYNYILKKFSNYDICKLQELPGYMNDKLYVGVLKSSQHKKIFKVGLLKVHESGLEIRTKNRLTRKPKCYNEAGNFQSVRIYDCQSIFILYCIGVFISLIVLVIEKITVKYHKGQSQ